MDAQKLPILYEDEHLLVLNKRACLHSTALLQGGGESLAHLLLAHEPALRDVSENPGDAGLVQRLDFETSGVILCARTKASWVALRELLLDGHIEKSYLAALCGNLTGPRAVSSYIGSRSRSSATVRCELYQKRRGFRGLPGTSYFTPVGSANVGECLGTLVRATASPARRHQVRAHAALIGFPLIGDVKYGAVFGLARNDGPTFLLHAESISFTHPFTRERLHIIAP